MRRRRRRRAGPPASHTEGESSFVLRGDCCRRTSAHSPRQRVGESARCVNFTAASQDGALVVVSGAQRSARRPASCRSDNQFGAFAGCERASKTSRISCLLLALLCLHRLTLAAASQPLIQPGDSTEQQLTDEQQQRSVIIKTSQGQLLRGLRLSSSRDAPTSGDVAAFLGECFLKICARSGLKHSHSTTTRVSDQSD